MGNEEQSWNAAERLTDHLDRIRTEWSAVPHLQGIQVLAVTRDAPAEDEAAGFQVLLDTLALIDRVQADLEQSPFWPATQPELTRLRGALDMRFLQIQYDQAQREQLGPFNPEVLVSLRHAGVALAQLRKVERRLPAEALRRLRRHVVAAREEVLASDDVDSGLRAHLLDLLRLADTAIDQYEFLGIRVFQAVLDAAVGRPRVDPAARVGKTWFGKTAAVLVTVLKLNAYAADTITTAEAVQELPWPHAEVLADVDEVLLALKELPAPPKALPAGEQASDGPDAEACAAD
jgi:hypothetical protein